MLESLTLKDPAGSARIFVRPVVEVYVFSTAPRQDVWPGMLHFHRVFSQEWAAGLRWYKTNVMKRAQKLDVAGFMQLEQSLKSLKPNTRMWGLQQHSGSDAKDYAPPAFESFSEELSTRVPPSTSTYLRACLPVELAREPQRLLQFCHEALRELPLDSGYCGYSCYWETGDSEADTQLQQVNRGWLKRFPGLAYGHPMTLLVLGKHGLPGVGWLTFLGENMIRQLSDRGRVLKELGQDVSIQEDWRSKAWLIRAGERPELGDVNRGETLPNYQRIGHALAEVRMADKWMDYFKIVGMDKVDASAWYGRFFGGTA
jgi:hypothetical protein